MMKNNEMYNRQNLLEVTATSQAISEIFKGAHA
jgi:hypothetical protein